MDSYFSLSSTETTDDDDFPSGFPYDTKCGKMLLALEFLRGLQGLLVGWVDRVAIGKVGGGQGVKVRCVNCGVEQ